MNYFCSIEHFHFSIMLSSSCVPLFTPTSTYFFIIHCPVLTLCSSVFLFCPTSSLLPTPYSHCFRWLSLSLRDYFVAKLEPAVGVSSCVQAPQSFPQALQPSSLPLGLLVGMCNRVTCQSVRLAILPLALFLSLSSPPRCVFFRD